MVSRWACGVNRGRHIIVTVIFNDCKSVTVGANVGINAFVSRWRCLTFLGVSNDDGFVIDKWGNKWRSR
jgi:hypothetical protein